MSGSSRMGRWLARVSFAVGFAGLAVVARAAAAAPTPAAPVPSASTAPAASAVAPAPPPSSRPAASAPASAGVHGAPSSTERGKSFTDAIPCSACHTTTAWRAKGASTSDVKFDHSTTGFPLTGQHLRAACADCHNATKAIKRDCESCHEDFHRGRLAHTCDTCHSPAGWRVTRPLEIHRMTRFPLTGVHVLVDCTQCHQRASEQQWTDAPTECFACHEADYRRPTNVPVHVGTTTSAALPRDCSICHRSMAWVPANVPAGMVGSSSSPLEALPAGHDMRFPVSFGVHRTAACPDCHMSTAVPRAVRCIGCHAHDPVVLAQQHKQQVATDGPACLTCHPGGVRR